MKPANYHSRRRTILPLLAVLLVIGIIFLPGKNGAVSVLLRYIRVRKKTAEQHRLKREIDSLERTVRLYQDPSYASDLARRLLAPATDTNP
ncbi:MAG: hypothetical protein ABIK44_07035 [candidate division WOR-3 bacterium]